MASRCASISHRHLEEWRPDENGDYNWVPDNKNDLGRIERQQHFIRLAADKLLAEVTSNPLRLGDLLDAATNVITFDDSIDVLEAGKALASAAADGLQTFSVPVERYQDEGQDALLLVDGPETDAVLDYFRGTGPEPPAPDTADTSGATAT